MKSKFDKLFTESIKLYLEGDEEVPPVPAGNEEPPEEESTPTKVEPEGEDSPEIVKYGDEESALPDIKEQETVKIDLLNTFIDFLQLPKDRQESIIRDYGVLKNRADSSNYQDKLKAFQTSLGTSDFPKKEEI